MASYFRHTGTSPAHRNRAAYFEMKYPVLDALRRERRMIGRRLGAQLEVILDERTVAKRMGISATMVNVIASEALYKVAMRMKEPVA